MRVFDFRRQLGALGEVVSQPPAPALLKAKYSVFVSLEFKNGIIESAELSDVEYLPYAG